MPQCPVCGGQEFDLLDGSYYCSECATQSQEMRQEELEDEGEVVGVRTQKIKTKVATKDHQEEIDEVWMTTDAFNIILFKQCQALITLGVDPTFKDVVLQLWVMYLRKCEKAFVTRKRNWYPKLPSKLNSRDLQVVLNKPVTNMTLRWTGKTKQKLVLEPLLINNNHPKRIKEIIEKKRLAALSKAPDKRTAAEQKIAKGKWGGKRLRKEIDPLPKSNGKDTTSENPLWEVSVLESAPNVLPVTEGQCLQLKSALNNAGDADSAKPEMEKLKKGKQWRRQFSHTNQKFFSKVALKKFATRKKKNLQPTKCLTKVERMQPDVLTLEKLLSFPLLGLRLIGSPVLVSDFARWIREGHIPYLEAYKLLPSSWTLYSSDMTRLSPCTFPKLESLYSRMRMMARFLEIKDPRLVPLKSVAVRYYSDLNLPYDLLPILMTVVEKLEYRSSKTSRRRQFHFVPVEMNASHCILITLKLVMGLDGSTERELSKAAQERNLSETGNFFVWTDWECQTEMILQHLTTCCPHSFLFRLPDCIDSDSVSTHVQTNKLGRPPEGITKHNNKGDCLSHNRSVIAFRKTYTMLNKETNLWTNFVGRCASSFPLTVAAQKAADKLGIQLVEFSSKRFPEPFVPAFTFSSGDGTTRYSRSFNLVCSALSANLQTYDLTSTSFESAQRFVFFGRQRKKQKTNGEQQ